MSQKKQTGKYCSSMASASVLDSRFLSWLTSMVDCDLEPKKPSPPQVGFGWCCSMVTESKPGQVSPHDRNLEPGDGGAPVSPAFQELWGENSWKSAWAT